MFIKLGLGEPAPMLLGFVLGRLMEEAAPGARAFRRSFMTFVERPVAAVLLAIAAAVMLIAVLPAVSRSRQKAFQE